MNTKQVDKLSAFLEDLAELSGKTSARVQAILYSSKNKEAALELLAERTKSAKVYSSDEQAPSLILQSLHDNLNKSKMTVITADQDLPTAITNQLLKIADGNFVAILPGQTEVSIINPLPSKSGVLLVINSDIFDSNTTLQSAISSVCRI